MFQFDTLKQTRFKSGTLVQTFYSNINTLRPRQNGRHFADGVFKCIFLNGNWWISIKTSLKFVPKDLINNILALVQIMAWRRPGDKPFLNQWWLVYWRIYASLGLNELMLIVAYFSRVINNDIVPCSWNTCMSFNDIWSWYDVISLAHWGWDKTTLFCKRLFSNLASVRHLYENSCYSFHRLHETFLVVQYTTRLH